MIKQRFAGRAAQELRPFSLTYNVIEYAPGSVLFQIGRTKVLCSISIASGVPAFLRGKKTGWLTAEYAMLPAATLIRKERETVGCKRNARAVEISRFIGRVIRCIVDLSVLGEKTITIDCDVIQADGGTRSAAICAAYAALRMADERWIQNQIITTSILLDSLGAISVGWCQGTNLLDMDCLEDNFSETDFNFVMTATGKIIEIQGTAEKKPLDWSSMNSMYDVAYKGITSIIDHIHSNPVTLLSPAQNKKSIFNPIGFKQPQKQSV